MLCYFFLLVKIFLSCYLFIRKVRIHEKYGDNLSNVSVLYTYLSIILFVRIYFSKSIIKKNGQVHTPTRISGHIQEIIKV